MFDEYIKARLMKVGGEGGEVGGEGRWEEGRWEEGRGGRGGRRERRVRNREMGRVGKVEEVGGRGEGWEGERREGKNSNPKLEEYQHPLLVSFQEVRFYRESKFEVDQLVSHTLYSRHTVCCYNHILCICSNTMLLHNHVLYGGTL